MGLFFVAIDLCNPHATFARFLVLFPAIRESCGNRRRGSPDHSQMVGSSWTTGGTRWVRSACSVLTPGVRHPLWVVSRITSAAHDPNHTQRPDRPEWVSVDPPL